MPLDQPTQDIPNIVPVNNLRLPDALTVKYGPAPLLAQFVLQGDRAVRDIGMRLRIRHDFEDLVYINKQLVAEKLWYPLINMFDPQYTELLPEDSFWLSGEDDDGNIILTWAARVFYWPDTTLADHIGIMLCDKMSTPRPAILTPEAAQGLKQISGVVFWGGSLWIHPDFRHRRLSPLVGRLGRAFAVSRWPLDWVMCLVEHKTVKAGLAAGYGYQHMIRGIFFPGSQFKGEVFAVYLSVDEAYADFSRFLAEELSQWGNEDDAPLSSGSRLLQTVRSISPDEVLHGNSSRS
jgi:hypothetical protein